MSVKFTTEDLANAERKEHSPLCSSDLLGVVVEQIAQRGQKFKDDYGFDPYDVCLGPKEFDVIYHEGRTADERPPDWHYKLAPMFYKGMRVRLMSSPGVLVGILNQKDPSPTFKDGPYAKTPNEKS
jgi:hypothetical protein